MAKSLEQILGYVPLTGIIKTTTSGIPDKLPPGFASITRPTVGDIGRYVTLTGTRTTAKRVERGSPAVRVAQRGIGEKDVKLIQSLEEIQIDEYTLALLRNFDNYDKQQMGIQLLDYQITEFRRKFDNTRIAQRLMALSLAKIYYDSNGNLLPSSSGASLTVDYGINATTNQGAGQDMAGNALIVGSWATASVDVPSQLRLIKQTSNIRTGWPLKYALYGKNIPSYLAANNYVKEYLYRNMSRNEAVLSSNEVPPNLMDLTWVPAYEHFYEDSGGTNRIIWPDDLVVFTPEPNSGWYENMEGTTPVPTSLNVMSAAMGAHESFKDVRGMFSYAYPNLDIPGYWKLFAGDLYLPILKNPNAVFQLDVTQ